MGQRFHSRAYTDGMVHGWNALVRASGWCRSAQVAGVIHERQRSAAIGPDLNAGQ